MNSINHPPCNISAIEDIIRIRFIQNSVSSQRKPYIVASWQNAPMRLDLSDLTEINVADFLTQPIFYFFRRIVRWLPSMTANNPENAETEGASVAGMKGG
jgi:hypothetical protein